ncbi:MAG: lipoyl(octanoyl) transferase LipB [Spirochaetales bacterium]
MVLGYKELGLVPYQKAWALQETLRKLRTQEKIPNTLLLLEHPPVITLGRRAQEGDILLDFPTLHSRGVEVVRIDRGGEVTYHGPGQLVGYLIFHLSITKGSIKELVNLLEKALISALQMFGIKGHQNSRHRGVWVGEEKIAALGLSVSHQVTTHGFALNVCTDLSAFRWIVPCGIRNAGVTSMEQVLGTSISLVRVIPVIRDSIQYTFSFSSLQEIVLPEVQEALV